MDLSKTTGRIYEKDFGRSIKQKKERGGVGWGGEMVMCLLLWTYISLRRVGFVWTEFASDRTPSAPILLWMTLKLT